MSSEPITDSPDPRLQAALAEYLERVDRGEAVDRDAFLAEFPDLAEELAPLLETADALEVIGGNGSESRLPDVSTHSQLSHDIETIAPGRRGQDATTSGPLPVEFGRYRTIKPLGQGAMGVVYLAEDTQLHRKVALKTSSFDDDQSGELLERFYREARSAATLRHPNICPVYDVGEIQGRHYISMAYIEGRTLATYVNASGSLHERQVLVLIRKLALALQDAHQHEIVHRDLKPANIMVDLKGEPIIMDFGLARVGYSEEESRLTQVGMIVGSPAYMSPEQVGGRPEQLTGAADQYSLGVILFELLIGHPPFRGPVTAVVGQILTQPPPRLSSLRSDVSPAVEALCLKMLAKSPNERFASMKHVADEIVTLLRGSSSEMVPAEASTKSISEDGSSPVASTPKATRQGALIQEARQRLKQRDYPNAIEMLQQIPEAERPPEAAKLLAQALKLMDEVNFVLQEMEAALQSRDGAALAKRAQELVKLKPDHPRARQVRELIKKHGPERALQFLAESMTPPSPVTSRARPVLPVIATAIVMLGLALAILFWPSAEQTRIEVIANDPLIEVSLSGKPIPLTHDRRIIEVAPGDQDLSVRYSGRDLLPARLHITKGQTAVITIENINRQLVARVNGDDLGTWALNDQAPMKSPAIASTASHSNSTASDATVPLDVSQKNDTSPWLQSLNQEMVKLNTDGTDDAFPWLLPNELTIYFTREESGKPPEIWTATRSSQEATFDLPKRVLAGRHMVVSADERYAVLLPEETDRPQTLLETSRPSIDAAWSTPRKIESLLDQLKPKSPWLSQDGLTLVFQREQTDTDPSRQQTEFVICRRPESAAAWGTPDVLPMTPAPMLRDSLTWPCPSSDLLEITFCHGGDRHPEVFQATRSSTREPFGNYRRIEVGGQPLLGRSPRTSRSGGICLSRDPDAQRHDSDLECIPAPRITKSSPPNSEGWDNLLNGRDLSGWTVIGAPGRRVENGILIGETVSQAGWLRSAKEYSHFEFDFEYRLTPGSASGVFVRAWLAGDVSGKEFHEIQLLDETGQAFQLAASDRRTGSLYGQLTAKPLTSLQPNRWQRMTILVHEDQVVVHVNSNEVLRGKLPFGKPKRGFLGLQISPQRDRTPQRCEFRNLWVRERQQTMSQSTATQPSPLAEENLKEPGQSAKTVRAEIVHGLQTEIFEGQNFERKIGEQIEPNVECFWELAAPSKNAPVDNFSVRFTGWLRAPKTGRYKLILHSRDGARLKINNRIVIDNWKLKPADAEVSVELSQEPQPIEVEVFNADLYSWVSLQWQPAGTAKACHVPATALYPDLENAHSKAPRTSIEKTGLVAEYFDKSFNRRLATDRVYRIEEIWGPHSPRWGLPTDSGARYTGILVPPVSGQYKFITAARDHIRVWIDDKPVVEAKGINPPQSAVVDLEADKPHEVRVEIMTTNHGAHYVHWIPPGTNKEVSIPPGCLFPNKAAVRQAANQPMTITPKEEKAAPQTISAADRETIERGLAQLKADDEAAGKKLLKAFDEQIDKVRAAPKLSSDERVIRIKSLEDEKSLFEKHGHIPFSLAMRTETLKYLREFTDARTDAAKVYDRVITSLTKQKKDNLASLLHSERDIALGPKVVATWRTKEVQGGKVANWTIWSNGSVGKSDRQFLWMMDESRFAIQWFTPPNTRWVDTFVVAANSMKADIVNKNGEKVLTGERVAP